MLEKSAYLPSAQPSSTPAWRPEVRLAFRFAFLYWAIYMLPSPGAISLLELLPWLGYKISLVLGWPMHTLAPWVGLLFHLRGEGSNWHPTGSGDTAMDYMAFVITLAAALLGCVLWSAVSEMRDKRKEYRTAYAWIRLFLRFTLAITLLDYGFIKIFPAQFAPLGPSGLSESYGESSPMHLLWTFMGQSRPYTIFGGLMEAIPGALLLFRRTSTVGLLGAVAVLLNVTMLNLSYDVPVKLYSIHLLLMALFLLLPDAVPLWKFLVQRREASLAGVWLPRWEQRPLRIGAYVLQGLIVLSALYSVAWSSFRETRPTGAAAPLQGVYAIDEAEGFIQDAHWVQAFFEDRRGQCYLGFVGPYKMQTWFAATYDPATHTIHLADKDSPASFHWTEDSQGELTLSGSLKNKPASIKLHRMSPQIFQLNARGFHWVTEVPYNH